MELLKYLLPLFILISTSLEGLSQRLLILEKQGSTKQYRIKIGDKLTFLESKNPGIWQSNYIDDILPEANHLVLDDGRLMPVKQLTAYRDEKKAARAKQFSKYLLLFTATWVAYTGVNFATNEPVNAFHYGVAAGALSLGLTLRLFKGTKRVPAWKYQIFSLDHLK